MPGRRPRNPLEPLLTRKKKKQPPPLTVRLPPQMLQELNAIAEATEKPRNAIIVTLLRYGLNAYQESRRPRKRKRG